MVSELRALPTVDDPNALVASQEVGPEVGQEVGPEAGQVVGQETNRTEFN